MGKQDLLCGDRRTVIKANLCALKIRLGLDWSVKAQTRVNR